MKKRGFLLLTAAVSVLTCFNVFAGQWEQDDTGWYFDNGDSTYPQDGWTWIDGTSYYFTPEGYCLVDTTTPDGYQVNGSGAWVIDGVVQQQSDPGEVKSSALRFEVPSGFYFYGQTHIYNLYASYDQLSMIGTYDFVFEADPVALGLSSAALEQLLDESLGSMMGTYTSKANCQLSSGTWRRYEYPNGNTLNSPGTLILYARFSGNRCHAVFLGGQVAKTDTYALMNAAVK